MEVDTGSTKAIEDYKCQETKIEDWNLGVLVPDEQNTSSSVMSGVGSQTRFNKKATNCRQKQGQGQAEVGSVSGARYQCG